MCSMTKKQQLYMNEDQLLELESELESLKGIDDFKTQEINKLNEINAHLASHNNPKNKINYHNKVKEENYQLKTEKNKLVAEVKHLKMLVDRQAEQLKTVMPVDKENKLNGTSGLNGSLRISSASTTPNLLMKKKISLTVTPSLNKTMNL